MPIKKTIRNINNTILENEYTYETIEGNKVSRIFFRDGQVYFKTDNTKFTVKYMNEEQLMRYLIYGQ